MSNVNLMFCRQLLNITMEEVRAVTTPAQRKAAWVYRTSPGSWEFHGPGGFYWYGRADNAYDARAHGWRSYLRGNPDSAKELAT